MQYGPAPLFPRALRAARRPAVGRRDARHVRLPRRRVEPVGAAVALPGGDRRGARPRARRRSRRSPTATRRASRRTERFHVHKTVFPADFLGDFGFRIVRSAGRVGLARLELGGLVTACSRAGARRCCASSRRRSCPSRCRRRGPEPAGVAYAAAAWRAVSSSAIWIAFSAAPLRRLSLARKRARPFSTVGSRRMRPTSTSSMPAALPGEGSSSSLTDGAAPSSALRLRRRERLLGLDPDGLGVADHDRDAHARRLDRQLGQLHDLARLGAELRLLVELLAVEVPVHAQVVLGRGLAAEPLHRLRPGARDRLVRGDAHAREARLPRASGLSTQVSGIVQQFGLAMIPSCSSARPPFTSGTTSGIPARAGRPTTCRPRSRRRDGVGTSSREAPVPTEKRKMSTSPRESASGVASSTVWPPTSRPAERADAKTRTFSKPCSRRSPSVTVPTAPVPPTTPTRVSERVRLIAANRVAGGRPSAVAEAALVPAAEQAPGPARRPVASTGPARHISRRPESARPRVTSSAYSRSPPTGSPLARRVTRTRSRRRSAR